MKRPKVATTELHRALLLGLAPAIAVARLELSAAIHPGGSSTSGPVSVDHTDVALGASITTFKTIREIAEGLPIPCGPLKATCGIMILMLQILKAYLPHLKVCYGLLSV